MAPKTRDQFFIVALHGNGNFLHIFVHSFPVLCLFFSDLFLSGSTMDYETFEKAAMLTLCKLQEPINNNKLLSVIKYIRNIEKGIISKYTYVTKELCMLRKCTQNIFASFYKISQHHSHLYWCLRITIQAKLKCFLI